MEPFKADDGREIPLRRVGRRYVQMVMDQHVIPSVPTYEATTVAGEKETHPHVVKYDAEGQLVGTTLQSDEDWAIWNAYQAARSEAIGDRMEAVTRFLLCQCVELEPEPVDEWSVDFALWGLTPPDPGDAQAFKLFWIENELLPDPDDLARLVARVFVIGGLTEEDQAGNLEQFFRLTVARLSAG